MVLHPFGIAVFLTNLVALSAWALDAPGEVMPDRHWDFEHLHLQVRVDPEAGEVRGTATHTVSPLGAPAGKLRLHQQALEIERVEVDGELVVGWLTGDETLEVPMVPAQGPRTVSVTYTAHPQTGMHFRRPGKHSADSVLAAWTQGQGQHNRAWFPGWDHPSDRFTLSTELTVPEGLHAVANGALVGTEPAEEGWTTWSYRMDERLVTYLVAAVVGEYVVYTDEGDGVPLEYVVPRTLDEETARRTLAAAAPQLTWFGQTLDAPYPYPVYRQALVERFLYSGMENSTLTLIGDHRLVPADDPHQTWRTEGLIAHELAHQWFGDHLTCYGWRDLWLNEGSATYWTNRWLEHAHGPDFAAVRHRDTLLEALEAEGPLAPRGLSPDEGGPSGAYEKGASVLRMLEVYLGRQVFDAASSRWVREHGDSMVETEQLRRVLEDECGEHLGWLFDRWVHSAGAPKLQTSWTWEEGQLTVAIVPAEDSLPWPLEVEVEVGSSPVRTVRAWVEEGTTRVVQPLDAAPRWVAVDPRRAALVHWTHQQPRQCWVAQATDSPTAEARLKAIHHLADLGEAGAPTLASIARDPDHHGLYRAEAAVALGRAVAPEHEQVLISLLSDQDALVRAGAAQGLGHALRKEAASQALAAATSDASPEVRRQALEALAKVDPDRALDRALSRLRSPDAHPAQVEWVAAVHIIGDHGRPQHLGRLLDLLGPAHQRPGRTESARAAPSLVHEGDRRLCRALEAWLDDPDLKTRRTAIRLLARIGDERSALALEAWARTTKVPRLRDEAQEAAVTIRSRTSP